MPAPHHSISPRPNALSDAQPTVSKHWRLSHDHTCCDSDSNISLVYRLWDVVTSVSCTLLWSLHVHFVLLFMLYCRFFVYILCSLYCRKAGVDIVKVLCLWHYSLKLCISKILFITLICCFFHFVICKYNVWKTCSLYTSQWKHDALKTAKSEKVLLPSIALYKCQSSEGRRAWGG